MLLLDADISRSLWITAFDSAAQYPCLKKGGSSKAEQAAVLRSYVSQRVFVGVRAADPGQGRSKYSLIPIFLLTVEWQFLSLLKFWSFPKVSIYKKASWLQSWPLKEKWNSNWEPVIGCQDGQRFLNINHFGAIFLKVFMLFRGVAKPINSLRTIL